MSVRKLAWSALGAALVLLSSCVSGAHTRQVVVATGPGGHVSLVQFRAELSPYGEWVYVPGAGEVWRPYPGVVGRGFHPYVSAGTWEETPEGWSFRSEHSWGWIPFHYGRWALDASYGWVWVPDTVWGPSWVEWRAGDGYVGWAPLPPRGWRVSYADPWWSYVEARSFRRPNVSVYVVQRPQVRTIHRSTAPVRRVVVERDHRSPSRPQPARTLPERSRPVRAEPVRPSPQRPDSRPSQVSRPSGAQPARRAEPRNERQPNRRSPDARRPRPAGA